MSKELMSISEIVRRTGIAKHRIVYALETGHIREPQTLNGRRCFSSSDLRKIQNFFQRRDKHEKQ